MTENTTEELLRPAVLDKIEALDETPELIEVLSELVEISQGILYWVNHNREQDSQSVDLLLQLVQSHVQKFAALEETEGQPGAEEGETGATLNVLRNEAYGNALEKGFHEDTPEVSMLGWLASDAMKMALIHSEVSEVVEALREGDLPDEHWYRKPHTGVLVPDVPVDEDGTLLKPEGVPAELADIIIRVLDYCGARRIDIARAVREKMDYNATRPAMHGKSF